MPKKLDEDVVEGSGSRRDRHSKPATVFQKRTTRSARATIPLPVTATGTPETVYEQFWKESSL